MKNAHTVHALSKVGAISKVNLFSIQQEVFSIFTQSGSCSYGGCITSTEMRYKWPSLYGTLYLTGTSLRQTYHQ